MLYEGSGQLVATVHDSQGAVMPGAPVSWSSSDSSVLAVSSTGGLGFRSSGTVQIFATSGPASASRQISAIGLQFASVVAGQLFTCAGTSDQRVYCWGSYKSGPGAYAPVNVPFPIAMQDVAAGEMMGGSVLVCGISASAALYCWMDPASVAAPIGSPTDVTALTSRGSHHCALTASGQAFCWGNNSLGQLGTESPPQDHAAPTAVAGGLAFASIVAGINHTCGLTPAAAAYCWGSNSHGQLGSEVQPRADSPAVVNGPLLFRTIAAGAQHSCALAIDSLAYCWGGGSQGQLGTGSTGSTSAPTLVTGNHRFAALAAGLQHTCAITGDGPMFCWGANFSGELGTGSVSPDSVPVAVSGNLAFAQVSAGLGHTCGLTQTHRLYCWGSNQFGQLGVPTITSASTPVLVAGQ